MRPIPFLRRLCAPARRLARDARGVALVEFAISLPVLILLYLGAYVISDAITCNRKVTRSARAVTDLVSRYAAVSSSDLQTIMGSSAMVLSPYDSSIAQIRVSEVQVVDASTAKVVWSKSTTNWTALTAGNSVTLTTNLVPQAMLPDKTVTPNKPGAYFLMGEVSYPYTPQFGLGFISTITMNDRIFMLPRLSDQIPLQ